MVHVYDTATGRAVLYSKGKEVEPRDPNHAIGTLKKLTEE